jgi:hypothetical protein
MFIDETQNTIPFTRAPENRRSVPRRKGDNCVAMIDGTTYPVQNWSEGGMMIQADERLFSMAAPVETTVKFRLGGRIVDIPLRGHVIRKTRDRLSIQFDAFNREIQKKFQHVIDDYITREFIDSQLV